MIRGTTPTHEFNIPFNTSVIKEVKITYAQNNEAVVEKKTSDCKLVDQTISVTLTQEDTFKFDCKKPVEIQVRILTFNGDALSTVPQIVGVCKCLDNEVLK
jgi:hypothetical protein